MAKVKTITRSIRTMATSHGSSKYKNLPRVAPGPLECPHEVGIPRTWRKTVRTNSAREQACYAHHTSTKAQRFPLKNAGRLNYTVYSPRMSRHWTNRCREPTSNTAVGMMIWLRIRLWRVWRCRAKYCIIVSVEYSARFWVEYMDC